MTDFKVLNKQKGFTLVELIVVVVILGLVSSAAFSLFTDGNRRAKNAQRDSDTRSMVSSARAMKTDNGRYPINSVDYYNNVKPFISAIPSDPASSRNAGLLGTALPSYDTQEYTYSYYKPPQEYSDERVMTSARFEEDEADAHKKNNLYGRYKVGTMWGPTSEEMWSQGSIYSVGQTNPGTIILNPDN